MNTVWISKIVFSDKNYKVKIILPLLSKILGKTSLK